MINRSLFPAVVRIGVLTAIGTGLLLLPGCDGGGTSPEPPSPPTSVQATTQDGSVSLTWDGGADASGYNVYRSTSSFSGAPGTPVNGDTPLRQPTLTDDAVDTGTRYYYRVTAVGEGGESDPSAEVSVRPFPSPPPRPEHIL